MVPAMTNRTAADLRQEWGETLRLERVSRRLSQEHVGRQAGIYAQTVSRMENGRGSLDIFLKVSRVLDVNLLESQS